MTAGHMNIKRLLHRSLEELIATKKIAKITSWGDAFATVRAKVDIQIMNYNGYYESPSVKEHLLKKHDVMIDYYEKTFLEYLNTYTSNKKVFNNEKNMSDCIWVCWWQGLDNAPELVKRCVESIKKHAGNHQVILLSEHNYRDYVSIPEWVEEKMKNGIITRTNYSDLLRLSLLAEQGGMWLDATFFCMNECLDNYFNLPIWSIKRPDYAHASVASGYFAGYSLACNYEYRWVFATIRDFFLNYWKNNDTMVDYLMVDYMIVLAQRKVSEIAEVFKSIPDNNPLCDELYKLLGEPFDARLWEKLKKDTSLYKLTWKQKFPVEKDGKETFYAKLLNRTL